MIFWEILKSSGTIRRVLFGFILLVSVFTAGVLGFILIEHYRLIDAMYMTMITVATVGYGEIQELSDTGKVFTMVLIALSVGTYAYAISIITSFIIEGEFSLHFNHIRVNKNIENLEGHVIVCGFGRNGSQAVKQLQAGALPFVVVESNPQIIEELRLSQILFVHGNATEDEILKKAGIDKAFGLIATLPHDADNVFVVLTARGMNSQLKIVSRASTDATEMKLKRAGANNVILPDKIGGAHMAALITKPDVLEFLDHLMARPDVRIEEWSLLDFPDTFQGKSLASLRNEFGGNANIIGLRHADGAYVVNPPGSIIPNTTDKLFVLGNASELELFVLHRIKNR